MNAVLMNGDLVLLKVISKEEAIARLESLKMIYPDARIVDTDDAIDEAVKLDIVPEEIEDKGCAGGGCTL